MANGITSATRDDKMIQLRRFQRAAGRESRRGVGYLVGWGFESDYVGANNIRDRMMLNNWLRFFVPSQRVK